MEVLWDTLEARSLSTSAPSAEQLSKRMRRETRSGWLIVLPTLTPTMMSGFARDAGTRETIMHSQTQRESCEKISAMVGEAIEAMEV